ncbi:MAG: DUF1440 domain-containing protein [Acidobacteriota bacterium]|nr:DUF1440 domain-containing protein [Acidobacteriota bacterium]
MANRIWTGLGAGLAGGLIASAAMGPIHSMAAKLDGSGPPEGEDATVKTASAISEGLLCHKLTKDQKKVAGPLVHFGFGAEVGALYGAVAEAYPAVTVGFGMPFGAAVWLGAHVIMVPALGLSKPATQSPVSKEAAELAAHLVYGAVTEFCRRLIRR